MHGSFAARHFTIHDTDPHEEYALLSKTWDFKPTPLRIMAEIADSYGFKSLLLKDESNRMGASSFKALGGRAAVAALAMSSESEATVICATAGNHGLSVADGASAFGLRAIVYVADTVSDKFVRRLKVSGAEVYRVGASYEEAMVQATLDAKNNGWWLISDSSWDGYRDVPSRIMRGYCLISDEIRQDCLRHAYWPTHVSLQAGVGGMAAAVAARIRATWEVQPEILIVEPEVAACLAESIPARKPARAKGAVSNMGRLDCKEASVIAYEVLRQLATDGRWPLKFIQVSDKAALDTKKQLAKEGVPTSPSGAAGVAGLVKAGLPRDARPLAIITESSEND